MAPGPEMPSPRTPKVPRFPLPGDKTLAAVCSYRVERSSCESSRDAWKYTAEEGSIPLLDSIGNVATIRAHMRSDTERFLHILTTLRTFLTRVVRGHGNHLATSTFSLVLQELPEHPPGCIGKSKSQIMVTNHVGRFQIF